MEPVIVTLYNVRALLGAQIITLCPVYSESKRKFFTLGQPIVLLLSDGYSLTIPTTYKTDLSSSPRWLWALVAPYGNFLLAAIIHDYLYSMNIGGRRYADREMLLWSVVINGNQWDNFLRYVAVRWFGRSWWTSARERIAREKALDYDSVS